MAYRNLDEFLIRLEQTEELFHITEPVTDHLQIERHRARHGNAALWFDHAGESAFPVVVNPFGTEKRMAYALGLDSLDDLETRLQRLFHIEADAGFSGLMGRAGEFVGMMRSAGVFGGGGTPPNQCQQHEITPDLHKLGLFPNNAVQLIYADADTQHIISADADLIDAHTLALHGIPPQDAPAAVVLGSDPAAMWSAGIALPGKLNPYWLAGWLRGRAVPMTQARTQPLRVPADAEIVIEGRLNGQRLHVSTVTHREGAVYPLLTENDLHWMARARERLMLPFISAVMPEITGLAMRGDHLLVTSVKSGNTGTAQRALYGLWGMEAFAAIKTMVVVEDGTDIHDEDAILQAVAKNVGGVCDSMRTPGALPGNRLGLRLGIDATPKKPPYLAVGSPPVDLSAVKTVDHYRQLTTNLLLLQTTQTGDTVDQVWAINPHQHMILVNETWQGQPRKALLAHMLDCVDWAQHLRTHPSSGALAIDLTTIDNG